MPGGPGYPGGRPQLDPDGSSVVFVVREGGGTHLYTAATDGTGVPIPILGGDDVVVAGLSVAARAGVAAVVLTDAQSFGEIAVLPLDGDKPTH